VETQQSDHIPKSGSEIKYGRSGFEDGASERLGCEKIQKDESDPA